ncbi:MAG: hypothetical protein ACKVQB_06070 [Bacteroidia bacterium]
MNRKELHIQIDSLLEKLAANNTMLRTHEGRFSQLETDLLRKQCIELYDAINQLHLANMMDKNTKPVAEIPKIEVVKKEPEPIIEPIIIEPIPVKVEEKSAIDSAIEKLKEFTEPKIEEIKKEEKVEEAGMKPVPVAEPKSPISFESPLFEPIVEKPTPVILPPKPPVVEEKSVLDKINEVKPNTTLHETISTKNEENELSHRFANSKIFKIKDAIDISKRFELQSGLFGGDSNAYNISISELEIAGNKEAALELFNRFAIRYHWNAENELAQELKSFIYRKY